MRFGDFGQNVNERVELADAPNKVYVDLEHLDSQNLHIRRRGKGSDVTGSKLRFPKGEIIFCRRRASRSWRWWRWIGSARRTRRWSGPSLAEFLPLC